MFENIFKKSHEAPKTSENSSDIVKKIKQYGIMSTAAAMLFLQSCEGSKERATAEDLKNHIENPELEKVNSSSLQRLQQQLAANPRHNIVSVRQDKIEGDIDVHDFYHVVENDSSIVLDVHSFIVGPKAGSDIFYHVEVDKATGIAYLYTKQNTADEAFQKGENSATMIVNKDGEIKSDNYREGDAKFQFDIAALNISTPTVR